MSRTVEYLEKIEIPLDEDRVERHPGFGIGWIVNNNHDGWHSFDKFPEYE